MLDALLRLPSLPERVFDKPRREEDPNSTCSRASKGKTSRTNPRRSAQRSMPKTPTGQQATLDGNGAPAVSSIRIAQDSNSKAVQRIQILPRSPTVGR